ncbi:site-specific integrase [Paludibacter sp. 221]|uniref:site-specific integrase n=1 Tax=Paludibacter sp. 221 TaxID=2302939 RepID=UPI0013D14BF9|nr:site-specific integrase [Paludibacter sp. 221]NDV46179.1 site-specific integrase [Paludibacter sp. 221]
MINIKLKLTVHKNENHGYIHVYFYLKREKVHFSTRVQCDIKNWNEKTMRVRISDPMAADKNLILENILARINSIIVKYRLKDKQPTKEIFLREYNRPDDYETFFKFTDEQKRKFARTLELGTINNHNTSLKKLQEYAPKLHFDDFTEDFVSEYYCHLMKTLGNNNNTTYKNLSVIRKYVNEAIRLGYMDEDPFKNFSIPRTKASYTYLEEEELKAFIELYHQGDLPLNKYKALQLFLFMCFSSLHIGDAKKMKIEQFTDTSFTYYRIKNRNRKPEPIQVPVSNTLRNLLKDIIGYRKKDFVFENLPADQTMNKYLKKFATELKINKDISHKTGRHTFATYFLSKTKDLNTLKEIMGHSNIRETLIYAHVLDKDKQEGITCFDNFAI